MKLAVTMTEDNSSLQDLETVLNRLESVVEKMGELEVKLNQQRIDCGVALVELATLHHPRTREALALCRQQTEQAEADIDNIQIQRVSHQLQGTLTSDVQEYQPPVTMESQVITLQEPPPTSVPETLDGQSSLEPESVQEYPPIEDMEVVNIVVPVTQQNIPQQELEIGKTLSPTAQVLDESISFSPVPGEETASCLPDIDNTQKDHSSAHLVENSLSKDEHGLPNIPLTGETCGNITSEEMNVVHENPGEMSSS